MGGEQLAKVSAKKIGLGAATKTASGIGKYAPVTYDGRDQLCVYLPALWAPQGVKKWPGKDGQPDKYEVQLVIEEEQRKQIELIDRAIKNAVVDNVADFWKGLDKSSAAHKYNSLIDIPVERPDLKPSITVKLPNFDGNFTSHFEKPDGTKLSLTTANVDSAIRRGARLVVSAHLTVFILSTGAFPVFTAHAVIVLPPQGRPVTADELQALRAELADVDTEDAELVELDKALEEELIPATMEYESPRPSAPRPADDDIDVKHRVAKRARKN